MPAATTVVGRRVVGNRDGRPGCAIMSAIPSSNHVPPAPSDAGATEMSLPESAPCPPCPSSAPTCRASSRAVATCPRPSSSMAKSPAACWAGCNTSGWRRRCWTRAVARATTCRCCVSAIRTRPTPAWTTASRCWPPRVKRHAPAGWAPGSASWRAWPGRARLHQWRPGADRPGAGIAGAGLVQPGLHWHRAPHAALAEWRRVLKVGGLAMFSCLGPATLRELRQALADAGLRTAAVLRGHATSATCWWKTASPIR